ncbi:translation initiation factor IF-2-like [Nasonia vitripennis]|uniref:Uncharacterized protein n=1 Tax=Nasonia vitripennis TaxID=7425 RepID=A0A7M7QKL5_NASVI|nr:translation initiation factor IF-2-like [Nasonia vitripennis]
MCCAPTPWPTALPAVLLGLRSTFKEDLQASPAEMCSGRRCDCQRLLRPVIASRSHAPAFVVELRTLMQKLRAVPGSRHAAPQAPFFHPDLRTCKYVFRRVETVRRTLEPPYSGPYKVLERLNDRVYRIEINGQSKAITTASLKPAFTESADREDSPLPAPLPPLADRVRSPPASPSAASPKPTDREDSPLASPSQAAPASADRGPSPPASPQPASPSARPVQAPAPAAPNSQPAPQPASTQASTEPAQLAAPAPEAQSPHQHASQPLQAQASPTPPGLPPSSARASRDNSLNRQPTRVSFLLKPLVTGGE